MSDTPGAPAPAATDRPYRAVSGWAAAGLGLAVVYFLGLAAAVVVAVRAGQPLQVPPATLLVPVAAAGLCAAGWLQVRRSEGLRAGAFLAKLGLFLSLLSGSTFAAYWYFTEGALRIQAADFTRQWLEDVRRSPGNETDLCAAFAATLDPATRAQLPDFDSPEQRKKWADDPKEFRAVRDEMRRRFFRDRGPLARFPENELVARVRQGGDATTFEAKGVRDWRYQSAPRPGYRLEQDYRVTTPEGVFDVVIPVLRADADYRWQVLLGEVEFKKTKLSALGGLLRDLRLDNRRFAADWAKELANGNPAAASGDLVSVGDLETSDDRVSRGAVEKAARALFDPANKGLGSITVAAPNVLPASPWKLTADELLFEQPFKATLPGGYRCEGRLVVATRDPGLLGKVRQAEQAGPDSAEPPRQPRHNGWRVVRVELETAGPAPKDAEK